MSDRIIEVVSATDEYIKPFLQKKTSSEKERIRMRKYLLAMEKLIHEIRRELLNESKQIKQERKNKKKLFLESIENAESLQEEKHEKEK